MKARRECRVRRQQGFSLIELLTVVVILMLVTGVVFQQIDMVQKRYRTEGVKLDLTQESREFLDQMVRDLHTAGYPNKRMYITALVTNNDNRNAVGLVQLTSTSLWFEGDVDGDGQVDSIQYQLRPNAGSCPCTLRRSQVVKTNGVAPLAQATNFNMEVSDVVNSAGLYTISGNSVLAPGTVANDTLYGSYKAAPVFRAYDANGLECGAAGAGCAALPLDINANPNDIAAIRSIRININVLAPPSGVDLQTRMRPALSMTAAARLNN
ncbi:MAG TPA: prepilin-type N-terminal cleavage/methylation domain-containing protein [Terriglobales bacterium]|nr:prepilin-type N-terminal cleavage/methylation domain-containing protein [Terriglobales bacterium]